MEQGTCPACKRRFVGYRNQVIRCMSCRNIVWQPKDSSRGSGGGSSGNSSPDIINIEIEEKWVDFLNQWEISSYSYSAKILAMYILPSSLVSLCCSLCSCLYMRVYRVFDLETVNTVDRYTFFGLLRSVVYDRWVHNSDFPKFTNDEFFFFGFSESRIVRSLDVTCRFRTKISRVIMYL